MIACPPSPFWAREIFGNLAQRSLWKRLVTRDEVGLGVDFDCRRLSGRPSMNRDKAVGRGATGFLSGSRQALLAQPVDGGVHIAVGLGQRLLAIHHARARWFRADLSPCSPKSGPWNLLLIRYDRIRFAR
jgi:hypothetical protein